MSLLTSPATNLRVPEVLLREHGFESTLPQQANLRRSVAATGIEKLAAQISGGLSGPAAKERPGSGS